MHRLRVLFLAFALVALTAGCNMAFDQAPPLTDTPGIATPTGGTPVEPSATVASPTTGPSPTSCVALVTANVNANVRKGPSTAYDVVGNLLQTQSAPVVGKTTISLSGRPASEQRMLTCLAMLMSMGDSPMTQCPSAIADATRVL